MLRPRKVSKEETDPMVGVNFKFHNQELSNYIYSIEKHFNDDRYTISWIDESDGGRISTSYTKLKVKEHFDGGTWIKHIINQ